mmetsp:Transcript_3362/g.7360  ORF Transcript_3362/g.7360 Transcript_3362/m.7360 type:complete len:113 (+) Transcript_3362:452-790(+)
MPQTWLQASMGRMHPRPGPVAVHTNYHAYHAYAHHVAGALRQLQVSVIPLGLPSTSTCVKKGCTCTCNASCASHQMEYCTVHHNCNNPLQYPKPCMQAPHLVSSYQLLTSQT